MGNGTLAFLQQGDSDHQTPAKRTEPDVAGLAGYYLPMFWVAKQSL